MLEAVVYIRRKKWITLELIIHLKEFYYLKSLYKFVSRLSTLEIMSIICNVRHTKHCRLLTSQFKTPVLICFSHRGSESW